MNIKKILSLGVNILLLLLTFPTQNVKANTYTILDRKEFTQNLSKGVVHKNIVYFTTEGWINVNVLKVDLTDKYTDVSVIFNPSGIKNRMSVRDMANTYGAVASVNGDFFDTTTGFVIGATVKDGRLITDPSNIGKLATFSIDANGIPSIEYWSKSMSVTLPNGTKLPLAAINKISSTFEYLGMYTRDWFSTSPGANENVPQLVEVVVDGNDRVLEVRQGQPPVEIPQGGYVLAGAGYVGQNLLTLKPGDVIQKDIRTNPPFENLKMAVSGGTILVKDGKIAPFTHEIKGYTARSAIGYTQDKKYLIIATVDGSSTRGMTQQEMANLMISLGAYDALNLDGGGSTQMAVRPLGDTEAKLANHPPEGYERKVANGIGIFNTAPQGNLYALKLEASDTNVFKGLHRTITVKGYDENYNPVTINPEEVLFSVNGITGVFSGNTFMPTSVGEGVITARVGNAIGTIKITSLDKPVDIRFNPANIVIDKNKSIPITVTAKNIKGYRALIEPQDITWEVYNNVGNIDKNGMFVSSNLDVTGALVANVLGEKAILPVKVGQGSEFDTSVLPKVTEFTLIDPANKEVPVKNTSNSFKFMVFGDTKYNTLLKLHISLKAADIANTGYPLAIFLGDVNEKVLKNLKVKYITTGDKYTMYNYNNSTFIVLNNRSGSLLNPDKNQWSWFKEQLNNVKGDNLFIILPKPVWGSDGFKDVKEATLFEETLKEFKKNTGKNVWIIYNGKSKFYTTLNDEIRYITTYGTDVEGNTNDIYNDFGFISIMVNGKEVNYQFKNLINK
ncbi:phosphodiester glycosidase family protein [Thermoanaerobacter mathranii]|uniref:phosphodiester glycosidase family protein n=1 Tax=Thermoanaerobacter mathranii TaxID=583357 RepID=UPI003AAF3154